ncbi:MAG: DUF4962 domain-containing protein [Planctomycetaceae bacterium]|jgi:hypothetical protein|nr:DUF4962 domain-containing protein [Planctomycetaceae bacterium]
MFLHVCLKNFVALFCVFYSLTVWSVAADIKLDESPTKTGEWGRRPFDGQIVAVTPPSFTWRPAKDGVDGVEHWELVVRNAADKKIAYQIKDWQFNVHTPPVVLKSGNYVWKYRGVTKKGRVTDWSQEQTFTVPKNARPMPLPLRDELLKRIPSEHPRIFVRPEGIPKLRELAKKELAAEYNNLVKHCDQLLKNPPDTTEPPLYQNRKEWKNELETWWGNRTKTIAVLENAATLAFVWNLGGNEEYAALAKKLLLAAAQWDPKGATGYRYNDEAGMPFAYHFARTYTFINAKLTEEEKQICRNVMKIRGEEMYKILFPKQFWLPYDSHANRAWHFLGEVGLAFHGEIPEADDWIWFAMNKFYAVYPVWSDDDGGWHEGVSYWKSYQIRFCWWADAMQAAFGINAFEKPYYSQIGYYPMYLMPPGTIGGCFGDLNQEYKSTSCLELVDIVAMQASNPYRRWYVDAHKTFKTPSNYYTFIRKAAMIGRNADKSVFKGKEPIDLPLSKWFKGTGIVTLNTTLLNSANNIQVQFKSTPVPFGSYSHGYDANNSYIFSAWNENLLINSGRRDYYGSPHHAKWMWSTRSENNITVDGIGQLKRSNEAIGEIIRCENIQLDDGTECDIVIGEAAASYRTDKETPKELAQKYPNGKILDSFRRHLVFLKPDVLVVYDRLKAVKPAAFDYWLHAKNPFQPLDNYFPNGKSSANDKVFAEYIRKRLGKLKLTDQEVTKLFDPITQQQGIGIRVKNVACRVDFLLPEGLTFTQTNQYDPNPQPKHLIREWHLTATTPKPQQEMEFLFIARPWKVVETNFVPTLGALYERKDNELRLYIKTGSKQRTICFPNNSDTVTVK